MRECVECGTEIEVGRVKAMPNVETCVHCQRQLEQQGRFKRHVMVQRDVFKNGGEIEETETKIVRAT